MQISLEMVIKYLDLSIQFEYYTAFKSSDRFLVSQELVAYFRACLN